MPETNEPSRVFPSTLADPEAAAEAVASTEAWDYIAHGAGDEATMRANADAWGRWMLRPHVLRDMSDVDVGTTVLGTAVSAPLLIAPSAMHRFVHDEGEHGQHRDAHRPVLHRDRRDRRYELRDADE